VSSATTVGELKLPELMQEPEFGENVAELVSIVGKAVMIVQTLSFFYLCFRSNVCVACRKSTGSADCRTR
jgi:hypothetical protein